MIKLKFLTLTLLCLILSINLAYSQNNPPLNLDVLPQAPETVRETYPFQEPARTPEAQPVRQNVYMGELPFDRSGTRVFEGFIFDVKEDSSHQEFKVHTSSYGEIKVKTARNTEFIPSKSAFKEGCYVIVKQYKNLNAASIEIPAIWDAKKRPGWHNFSGALQ